MSFKTMLAVLSLTVFSLGGMIPINAAHAASRVVVTEPAKNELDGKFSDISWTIDGGMVLLTLHRTDGSTVTLDPYPAEVVHLALASATESSPVLAGFSEGAAGDMDKALRLTLTAALTDTVTGCHAVSIAQLGELLLATSRDKRARLARAASARLTWTHALAIAFYYHVSMAVVEGALSLDGTPNRSADNMKSALQPVGEVLDSVQMQAVLAQALSRKVTVQKRLFTPYVDAWISKKGIRNNFRQCAARAGSIDRFAKCAASVANRYLTEDLVMTSEQASAFSNVSAGDKFTFTSLRKLGENLPPPLSIDVRLELTESVYSLDAGLSFARIAALDKVLPLKFELVVRLVPGQKGDERAIPPTRLPLPAPGKSLRAAVSEGHALISQLLGVRRLFRAILTGKLGSKFPSEKLPSLSLETADSVRNLPIPRFAPAAELWTHKSLLPCENLTAGYARNGG